MKTCEKCGVELFGQPAINGPLTAYEGPLFGAPLHTPERCRDRLAARLAEAEMQNDIRRKEHIATCKTVDALRAELAECRAELEAAKREIQVGENLLSRRQVAAEARAERYEKTLRDAEQWLGCEEPHVPSVLHNIRTALAETEKEKP